MVRTSNVTKPTSIHRGLLLGLVLCLTPSLAPSLATAQGPEPKINGNGKTEATKVAAPPEEVMLSFANADINAIVKWLSQMTGKSIIKHKDVKCITGNTFITKNIKGKKTSGTGNSNGE